MDLNFLLEYVNLIILGICLCVGYVIKHSIPAIPNKYIPLIMATLGTFLSVISNLNNLNLGIVLTGLFSGLTSTGLHELFKNIINKGE